MAEAEPPAEESESKGEACPEVRRDAVPLPVPSKVAFTVPSCFSPEECEELVALSEEGGFEDALVNVGGGRQMLIPEVRKSSRHIRDDALLADKIWQRIKHLVPDTLHGRRPVGLNERLRFLRYDEGDYFAEHMDGVYQRPSTHPTNPLDSSMLTFLLYLNEGFEGGALGMSFEDSDGHQKAVNIVPRTGLVVVHDHRILHEARLMKSGRRYCIRSDIMFEAEHARRGHMRRRAKQGQHEAGKERESEEPGGDADMTVDELM